MQAWIAVLTGVSTVGTIALMGLLFMLNRIYKQSDERMKKLEGRLNITEIDIKNLFKCYMSKELCRQLSGNCKTNLEQQLGRGVNTFNDIRKDIKELSITTKSEIKEVSDNVKALGLEVVKLGEHLPR